LLLTAGLNQLFFFFNPDDMRNIFIIFLVLIFTVPAISQEQPKVSSDKNVLKINALSMFFGTGSIFYERRISDLTSAQLGAAYLSYKYADTRFSGLIITPEFRIYPKHESIDGFYIAPYVRYQKFTMKNTADHSEGSLSTMGGGLLLGRQWITKSGFVMDLFFGAHYSGSSVTNESGTGIGSFDKGVFTGFKPRVGFALGFSF
jgi:hypothetical protein